MNTLEELLPGIEKFLCTDLSTEELTVKTEKKRQFFVERLEVLRLQRPPSLPPRPDGLAKSPRLPLASSSPRRLHFPPPDGASSSLRPQFPPPNVAALRELSRSNVSQDKSEFLNNSKEEFDDIYEEFDNTDHADDAEPTCVPVQRSTCVPVQRSTCVPVQSSVQSSVPADKPCPLASVSSDTSVISPTSVSSPTSLTSDIVTDDDQHYEVPLEQQVEAPPIKTPVDEAQQSEAQQSDAGSGTSYESYDDEEVEVDVSMNSSIYQNQAPTENIKLPMLTRVKNKKKIKKRSSKEDLLDLCVADLQDVLCSGELFHCGTFSWSRRFCVVTDCRFICYKTEKDSKPLLNFPLQGYSITYIDKEGKRSHIVKISQDGSKTVLFSADNKEKIDVWIEHLRKAASLSNSAESISKAGRSNSQSSDVSVGQTAAAPPGDKMTTSVSNTSCNSSSEGGSGDGSAAAGGAVGGIAGGSTAGTGGGKVTHSVSAPSPYDTKEYISCKERKRISRATSEMPSLEKSFQKAAHWFGTFGKKKGEKKRSIFYAVEVCDFMETNPGVDMAGYVKILTDLGGPKKWCKRFCYVKSGSFVCRKEISDEVEEFSLTLSGCEVSDAHETRKELAVKVLHAGHEKFIIEPADALEQGNWLSILIRETGCAKLYTKRAPPPLPDVVNPDGEFDQEYENIEFSYDGVTRTVAEVNLCYHGNKQEVKTEELDLSAEFLSTDDLYDEVYQNSSENVMAFLENSQVEREKPDADVSQSVEKSVEGGTKETPTAPPLPNSPPPPRPRVVKATKESISQSEKNCEEDWYDDVEVCYKLEPDSEKVCSDAEKVNADAEKVNADAEKVNTDTEVILDTENKQINAEHADQAKLSEDEGEDVANNNDGKEKNNVPLDTTTKQPNDNNVNDTDNLISASDAKGTGEGCEVVNKPGEGCEGVNELGEGCEQMVNMAVRQGVNKPGDQGVNSPCKEKVKNSNAENVKKSSKQEVNESSEERVNVCASDESGNRSRSSSVGSCPDDEASKEELSSLRRKVLQTRKKRADLRAKKIQARKPSDKEALDAEIKTVDKELKSLEDELQKLQEAYGSPRKPIRVRSQKRNPATQNKGLATSKQNSTVKTTIKTFSAASKKVQTFGKHSSQSTVKSNGHKPSVSDSVKVEQSQVESTENKTSSTEELRPIVKERLKLWENIGDMNQPNC